MSPKLAAPRVTGCHLIPVIRVSPCAGGSQAWAPSLASCAVPIWRITRFRRRPITCLAESLSSSRSHGWGERHDTGQRADRPAPHHERDHHNRRV